MHNSLCFKAFSHFYRAINMWTMIINAPILRATNGYDGDAMRGNEAYSLPPQNQIQEKPMEARIARIESDVANIQNRFANVEVDIGKLRDGLTQATVAIAVVDGKVNTLAAKVDALDAKVDSHFNALSDKIDAKVNALESKMIKWMVGTVIAGSSLAFSIAKFVH
jgi:hypothetical protein